MKWRTTEWRAEHPDHGLFVIGVFPSGTYSCARFFGERDARGARQCELIGNYPSTLSGAKAAVRARIRELDAMAKEGV